MILSLLFKSHHLAFQDIQNNLAFYFYIFIFLLLLLLNLIFFILYSLFKNKPSFYIHACINDKIENSLNSPIPSLRSIPNVIPRKDEPIVIQTPTEENKEVIINKNYQHQTSHSFNHNNKSKSLTLNIKSNKSFSAVSASESSANFNKNLPINTELVVFQNNQLSINLPDNSPKKNTKHFPQIFCLNFLRYHPIVKLFKSSILNPRYVSSFFLGFNISNTLYLIVFYLEENDIIYIKLNEQKTKMFYYPIKNELNLILRVIASKMILVMLLRIIIILTQRKRNRLLLFMEKETTLNNKIMCIKIFMKYRLIKQMIVIGIIIMSIMFQFYVCMIFGNMYKELKVFWCWTIVWIEILSAVVICPFVIFFSSILESLNETPNCIYYFKEVIPY